jgi:hypothetical protein
MINQPIKKIKLSDMDTTNAHPLDAQALNRFSRQNAALGRYR